MKTSFTSSNQLRSRPLNLAEAIPRLDSISTIHPLTRSSRWPHAQHPPPVARHRMITGSKKRRVSHFGTTQRLNSDHNMLLSPQAPSRLPGREIVTLPRKVVPQACSSTEQSRFSVDMATRTSHLTTKGLNRPNRLSRCQQAMITSFASKCYQQ